MIRSEWIKLRSVRSTVVVLALSVVRMVVFPLLLAIRPSYNPIDQSLFGVHFATLTVVFAVTLAGALLAFAAGQARYGGASLASPGAVRAVIGTALFLTVMGLLGIGFGFLTRSTGGGSPP